MKSGCASSVGLLALCTVLACFFAFASRVAAGEKKVFILHSYELGHVCGGPQHDGALRALREAGFEPGRNLAVQAFAMDTRRVNTTPERMRTQARLALEDIARFSPDVLITLDDDAFRTVGLQVANTPLPVVFSGLNGRPESYSQQVPWLESRNRPGHNITGVLEKLHTLTALKVHRKILGQLTTVYVIADSTITGAASVEQVREELQAEPNDFLWTLSVTDSWEDYQRHIRGACANPRVDLLYPLALQLKDAAGRVYTAPEILRWTTQVCRKPDLAVNYSFVEHGLMGGVGVDFEYMGWQAGSMAARILSGESAGEMPMQEAQRYALVFNMARVRELGIEIPQDILLAADHVYNE
ncbi:ABC transporter substrate-binding protein [Desulfovibrio psychrotolerans]|uniref:Lipoprotein n=1 Tax=Desulfovibrio psychrotolerans TaxID=415242 RepID=A0A7J0BZL5_9BACT|nr:ABC transporter substrate binding protein [Desulfovibrio psychrotolerans]GFM38622.1 lipoprotein [Desulfovibrio psychrotolerans]